MKVAKDIGLLFCPGVRGLMYLASFVRAGLLPGVIISQGEMDGGLKESRPKGFWNRYVGYFDPEMTLENYVTEYGIEHVTVTERDVNSASLKEAVSKREENIFVFSGGGVIKPNLLSIGKQFIHIHPGLLPDYRGSTCFYYSMLKEDNCSASAFFMEADLDSGDVLGRKTFEVPAIEGEEDWYFYDLIFDPWLRAELLLDLLKGYIEKGSFQSAPQNRSSGEMYFIMHPVLKNIAIEGRIKNQDGE